MRRSKRNRYIRKSKPSEIIKEMRESYYLLTGMWQHYLYIVEFWYNNDSCRLNLTSTQVDSTRAFEKQKRIKDS
jgi:hypothetical protein